MIFKNKYKKFIFQKLINLVLRKMGVGIHDNKIGMKKNTGFID